MGIAPGGRRLLRQEIINFCECAEEGMLDPVVSPTESLTDRLPRTVPGRKIAGLSMLRAAKKRTS